VVVKASHEGFSLASEDKSFQLKVRGYVQADARAFLSDTDRPGSTGLLIRRARPILEGTLFSAFDFRLMLDFGGGTASVQDAYLDLKPSKALRLRAGKFKAPIGLERLQSGTQMLFIERGLPTNMTPNRDIGLQLHGELLGGGLTYALGTFNGVADGASGDANTDNSLDLVGRVFTQPFKGTGLAPLKGLGLGISVSRGKRLGTPTASGLGSYRSASQQVFFSYLTGTNATEAAVADGTHVRFSPQASYFWGPFGLLAEYISSSQEVKRGAESARLRHQSWQTAAALVLFGGSPSLEGVRPTQPLKFSEGTWGAVELVARYGELRVDPDAFPLFADPNRSAGQANSWGAGLNWYLNTNIRLALNLDRTVFERGAIEGDRIPETVLFNRFQVTW
jgi:phosphate-selective porin OprO/OprP